MENAVDFGRIFKKLVKRLWLVILVALIAGFIGILYTLRDTPNVYAADVSLYSVASGSYTASIQGFDAMKDYAEIVRSRKVADRVVNALPEYQLDANMIQSMVKTSYNENSAIFHIYVYANNPELAAPVANAVAEAFVLEVSNITGADSVKILDEADSVFVSYSGERDRLKTRLVFTVTGFLLICVIISVIEILSTKVTAVEDCTLKGEIKLLGVIPKHSI